MELFNDGVLIFSNPFEATGRIVESFVLVGDGSTGSSTPRQSLVFGVSVSLLLLMLLS